MRTIGRHWPSSAPRGDYPAYCDYCGVKWRRSLLKRDAAGLFRCPDEGNGRDAVTLAQLEAGHSQAKATRSLPVRVPDAKETSEYDP